jgi:trigger factor
VVESMREGAAQAVQADLALRAIADQEEIEPTEEDIGSELERLAGAYGMKPSELRRNLDRTEQMPAVRSDWKKSKALEWLLERVEIVDPEGRPIDRALLEPAALEDEDPKDQNPPDQQPDPKIEQPTTEDQESGEQ